MMRNGVLAGGAILSTLLFCAYLVLPFNSLRTQATPLPVWSLIWADEFEGSQIDGRRWVIADRGHANVDGGINYYDPREVFQENGNLVIQSHSQATGRDGRPTYSSGRVSTKGKFAFAYGKVEVRAKLPGSQGLWPAIWMLPSDRSWPPEIDVLELLGNDPHRIYMTHHWGSRKRDLHHTTDFVGPDFTQDFHTFSIEWEPGKLRWLIDDVERKVETEHVPGKAMYLILNTSVGGDWPGMPDETSVFPANMQVDYVRVYQHPKKRR